MAEAKRSRSVLYVGGAPLVRESIRVALYRFGLQVAEVPGVQEAVERLARSKTDVVLVDRDLLDDDATIDLVSALVHAAPKVPVAVLSSDPSPVLSADVLRVGAAGFLTKQTTLAEFRFHVDRLLQGQVVVDPVVARSLLNILGDDAPDPIDVEPAVHLSPIEERVLRLAADGFLNKQIATELGLSPLTVKNHLARIRARLNAVDKAHAVATAMRAGLLD